MESGKEEESQREKAQMPVPVGGQVFPVSAMCRWAWPAGGRERCGQEEPGGGEAKQLGKVPPTFAHQPWPPRTSRGVGNRLFST